MAIYHLQVKTVSRRDGRSAVAAAAYRSGERLRDERLGIEHDYTRKQGVLEEGIIVPEGAPDWMYDRERLWNAAEAAESRKDAKVAREYEIALPCELTDDQRCELAFDYACWLSDRHNMVVDVAIHAPHRESDQRNHHAHLLTTTREATSEGLGAKTRALDVSRTSSALIEEARQVWAEYCNDSLRRAQVLDRDVDHRSYERQGLDKTPTLHLGPEATAMERRGEESRIGEQNRVIEALNQARDLAKEQLERAREVLESLVDRVKELGHDVSEGLSEGLRRFQEAMNKESALFRQSSPTPEQALRGSQGAPEPGRPLRRFEEARDRFDEFRAERDASDGEDRRQAQLRMDWQRPALRQSFDTLAKADPVTANHVAYKEADKFDFTDDRLDEAWWKEQLVTLGDHPDVQADLKERIQALKDKTPEQEASEQEVAPPETQMEPAAQAPVREREQKPQRESDWKTIEWRQTRDRDRGIDIDF